MRRVITVMLSARNLPDERRNKTEKCVNIKKRVKKTKECVDKDYVRHGCREQGGWNRSVFGVFSFFSKISIKTFEKPIL